MKILQFHRGKLELDIIIHVPPRLPSIEIRDTPGDTCRTIEAVSLPAALRLVAYMLDVRREPSITVMLAYADSEMRFTSPEVHFDRGVRLI